MINSSLAKLILNEALSTGGDYAEIFIENSTSKNIILEKDKVEQSTTSYSTGVGLRLLKNYQCVYGYTSDFSKKSLLNLAHSLSASFNGKRITSVNEFHEVVAKTYSPIKEDYDNNSKEEIIDLILEGAKAIEELKNPLIVRYRSAFGNSKKHVEVYTSSGKHFKRTNQFGRLVYTVFAKNDKGIETGFEGPGTQSGLSYFRNNVHAKDVALKAAKLAIDTLNAKECPSGSMPVVIGNGWGGVLFHEACGHALEATSVAKKLSVFADKKGQMIASPLVTAIDDSTIPYSWGSIDIDDEGNPGEKRVLIKNGVLEKYLIDDFNGRRMKEKSNGCSRRQNFHYAPTSRMSNTYIDNGNSKPEDIIKNTKLGLYTVGFNGGSVDPSTGEFNFGCSEAYIIRNGQIAEQVKGATLIGKCDEILKNIDMVGNNLAFGEGLCGSSSGSIRTTVGQPTIRVKSMVVGGRGGELK